MAIISVMKRVAAFGTHDSAGAMRTIFVFFLRYTILFIITADLTFAIVVCAPTSTLSSIHFHRITSLQK